MAATLCETGRFSLPARVRTRKPTQVDFSSRLALADRIADLPGIHTVEHIDGSLPCSVDVYLSGPDGPARKPTTSTLLCNISREGICVQGLADWDKYQVLCRGWGKLQQNRVLIHLPRDSGELEVCWTILERAFDSLTKPMEPRVAIKKQSRLDLPRFSRTTHQ